MSKGGNKPDNDVLNGIRENVGYYSFRFRLICGDAKLKKKHIPRIEKAMFLRIESAMQDLLCTGHSPSTGNWLSLLLAYGFFRAAFTRVELLAALPSNQAGETEKLSELLAYYQNLKQSDDARYRARRNRTKKRAEIFNHCKTQGMTDADAYREIIRQERPDLKPKTTAFRSAMDALKTWKNRTFSTMAEK